MNLEDRLQIIACEEHQIKQGRPMITATPGEFYLYDLISLDKPELRRTNHMFYRVLNPIGKTSNHKNQLSIYNIKESIELLSKHKRKAKTNEKTKLLINKILRDLMILDNYTKGNDENNI